MTKHRLLAEPLLDLKKAFELAQGMEAAAQNICEMHEINQAAGIRKPAEIHLVSNKSRFCLLQMWSMG